MTLDARVDRLAEELHRPVVLYDRSMRLISYSAHTSTEIDENRRGAILERKTQPRALELIRASGAHRSTEPVIIVSDPGHADRIGIAVRHLGTIQGYAVATLLPDDLPISDVLALPLITASHDLGELLYEVDLADQARTLAAAEAVLDLIDPDPETRKRGAAAALSNGLRPSETGYVVTLVAHQAPSGAPLSSPDRVALNAAIALMRSAFPAGSISAISPLGAWWVSPIEENRPHPIAKLERHIPADFRLGVAADRVSLDELHDSAREARLACLATWRDPTRLNPVTSWTNLGSDQLLLQLFLENLTLGDFSSPVRALLETTNRLENSRTVEAYIAHGGDAQATAKALNIHRSTLYYRLDRITEITGADPRDGGARMDFAIGLRVARFAGLLANPGATVR